MGSWRPVRIHGEHGRDAIDPDGARRRYQWVRRAYSPFVSRYVAVSQDLERYLRERVGIAADRIVQIYNGVDSDRFHPVETPRGDRWLPVSQSEHWLVGTVGRMDQVKDQSTLARAFVLALRMNPAARDRMRLVIVGEGALRAECRAHPRRGGARELAWFAGERNDIPEIMRGLDCFVLPSLGEGISNTILEAMACALPVIATRVGGNPELVKKESPAAWCRADDPVALTQAMISYFENPALARQHGAAAAIGSRKASASTAWWTAYHELYLAELRASARRGRRPVSNLPSAES